MAKVSVIVPVYNVEKYLAQCIESILNQTLKDIEVICVNDGSKDSSLSILKDFSSKDDRVMVIDKENSGYGDTMNIGLSAATGEYISIVESDDFIDKNMLEDLYNIAKDNDCDVVKSDWFKYWTKNNQSFKCGKISPDWTNKVTSAFECTDILGIQPSIWSAIYKRSFLNENNINFLTTPGASYQDTSFTFKVFASTKKVFLTSKAYLYYRQDNPGSSINDKSKAGVLFKEYDEINRFIEERGNMDVLLPQKFTNEFKGYYWTMQRISESLVDSFIQDLAERYKDYSKKYDFSNMDLRKSVKQNILLIDNPQAFSKKFQKEMKVEKWNRIRRNLISIKINKSRISVKLFGLQLINVG